MRWRGLSFLVSAAMVMGLIPTPALAEALDAISAADKVAADEVTPDEDTVLSPASTDEIHQMELDETYDVTLEEGDESRWVGSFTAPQSGTYRFYSTGEYDTYAELYADAELDEYLDDDDQGGGDSNFEIVRNLDEGDTVYLMTREFDHEAASYSVTVESVDPRDLSKGSISLDNDTIYLSEDPYIVSATVLNAAGEELVEGTDYELVYYTYDEDEDEYTLLEAAPSSAGMYYVAARGIGDYEGETGKRDLYLVDSDSDSKNLVDATLQLGEDCYELNEGNYTVLATVTSPAGKELVEGTDYELVYYAYDEDEDEYTVLEETPSSVGEYYVAARGIGDYEGETNKESLNLVDSSSDSSDLSEATFQLDEQYYDLNEGNYTVLATVTSPAGKELVEGTDYELVYYSYDYDYDTDEEIYTKLEAAPSSVGEYYVAARGIGDYEGETNKESLRIYNSSDLTDANFYLYQTRYDLVEGTYTVDATVETLAGDTLTAGTDYELVYYSYDEHTGEYTELNAAPSSTGEYSVAARGIGDYEGETGKYNLKLYRSDSKDLADGTIQLDQSYYDLSEGDLDPAVTVKGPNENTLVMGTDYELVYYTGEYDYEVEKWVYTELDAAPSSSGEYYVAARGIVDYTGETNKEYLYIYNSKDLADASLQLDQDRFDLSEGDYDLVVTVTGADGNTLIEGTDYELAYFDYAGNKLSEKPSTRGSYYVAAVPATGSSYTGMTSRYNFTLLEEQPEIQVITLGETQNVFVAEGYPWTGSFTADEDGTYVIKTAGDFGTYIELYADEELSDQIDEHYMCDGSTEQIDLLAGKTIYLAVDDNYGDAQFDLTISKLDDHDLSFGYIGFSEDDDWFVETGQPIVPSVWVRDFADNTVPSSCYDLAYYDYVNNVELASAPSEPGSYGVKAIGKGDYRGETSYINFDILTANDLGAGRIALNQDTFEMTGSPIDIASHVRVKAADGTVLQGGTHYELVVTEVEEEDPVVPIQVNSYEVRARAIEGGGYTGETYSCMFYIRNSHDISRSSWRLRFAPSSTVTMMGDGVSLPTPLIYGDPDGDGINNSLVEGTDFELDSITASGKTYDALPAKAGTYNVTYKGIEPYSGTITAKVKVVDGMDMSSYDILLSKNTLIYTGEPQAPEVCIVDGNGKYLVEGTDYRIVGYRYEDTEEYLDDIPSKVGFYEVVCEGIDPYSRQLKEYFSIVDPLDLRYGNVSFEEEDFEYTGNPVDLQAEVFNARGRLLTEGTDYQLVYYQEVEDDDGNWDFEELSGAPSDPGEYYVAARALGDTYSGETNGTDFYIYDSGSTVDPTLPSEIVDLTLDEAESLNVQEHEKWFGRFTAPHDGLYAFSTHKLFGTPYFDLYADENFNEYLDYGYGSCTLFRTLKAGESVYIRVCGEDDYAVRCTVTVSEEDYHDLMYASVSKSSSTYVATGSAVTPDITVTDPLDNVLEEGTDYELVYKMFDSYDEYVQVDQPVTAGEYYAIARGKGAYKGETSECYFTLVDAKDLSHGQIKVAATSIACTGSAITPNVTVKDATGNTLTAGTDYELVYTERVGSIYVAINSAPSEPGRYRVAAKGKGAYTGTTSTANITLYDACDLSTRGTLTLEGAMCYDDDRSLPVYQLTGSSVEPTVVVNVKGQDEPLVAGTDYTVSYTNNTSESTYGNPAIVTVEGKDPYHGSLSESFIITRAMDLDLWLRANGATVTQGAFSDYVANSYEEITYLSTGEAIKPTVTFAETEPDAGIAAPIEGTDFTVSYVDMKGQIVEPVAIGSYDIVLTAKGSAFTGTTTIPFRIASTKDLSSYHLTYSAELDGTTNEVSGPGAGGLEFDVDPSLLDQVIWTVTDGATALQEGVDYLLEMIGDAAEGMLTYLFTGTGSYTGSVRRTVYGTGSLKPSVADATITVDDVTYNGSAQTPAVSVSMQDYGTLDPDTDYDVSYADNTNAGTATVTVTGKGEYTGTATATFTIARASLAQASVTVDASGLTYTGEALTPAVTVVSGGKTLEAGTDYETSYADNTNAGTAKVTVTGKGNYTGTATATFTISAATLEQADVTVDASGLTYTGEALTPAVTVTVGSKTLAADTDYEVSYADNTNAGTAKVTVTGKGSYAGTKTAEFTIAAASLAGASVTVDASGLTYTGQALTPAVTVVSGGKTLAASTDYTVSYANNTNKGTATATVTGKGNYTDTATANFTIAAASLENASVTVDDMAFTGQPLTPAPTVVVNGRTLAADTDYDVSYENNTNKGTATVTVAGKGNYTGTATATFTIAAKTLADASVTVDASGLTYTGEALTPAVTVKVGSDTLVADTDYEVSYADNTNAGTAKVTVTGKGDYAGTKAATFTIAAASLAQASVTVDANGLTYTGEALTPAVTVTVDGKALIVGTDYETSYADNTNAGTAKVTIDGKGNYTGTATAEFAIAPASITQASVAVAKSLKYTGKALKPKATVKLGGKTLKLGTDYTVTYTKNKNAGKATVTVKGKGNYGGSKKATFTIVKAANPMTVKAKAPSVKASKIKKKNKTIAAAKVVEVSKAQGKVTYKKASGNKKITVAADGKLTIKKRLKKGTYTVKISVTAAGNANYKALTKTIEVKVKVK